MKASYKELMTLLGVGRPLNAYESQPWIAYDSEQALTGEAEVRANDDCSLIEAEIQLLRDNPLSDQAPFEQICTLVIEQQKRLNNDYITIDFTFRGESKKGVTYDWEAKACRFFKSCVMALREGKIPDFDALLDKEMKSNERFGEGHGDESNKSPEIKPNQLLYDRKHKAGHGF